MTPTEEPSQPSLTDFPKFLTGTLLKNSVPKESNNDFMGIFSVFQSIASAFDFSGKSSDKDEFLTVDNCQFVIKYKKDEEFSPKIWSSVWDDRSTCGLVMLTSS